MPQILSKVWDTAVMPQSLNHVALEVFVTFFVPKLKASQSPFSLLSPSPGSICADSGGQYFPQPREK